MFSHIAMDRSARRVDADGHMHVEMTNISKANVCPYFGREIPDYVRLGLDANRVYMLYRDPAELAAAASTFAGKPLLLHHLPVSADAPAPELVVGTIGTDVAFKPPYLQASMSLWTREAIDAVESGDQRELSPGYRYRADMTKGRTPEGVAFDGIMRDIMGNHVALVAEGRTGPDVMVADETPPEFTMSMRFSKVLTVLAAILPGMKPEQALALDAALVEDMKPAAACVEDEFPDLSEDERKGALDKYAKDAGKELAAFSDEDKREGYKRAAADKAVRASAASTASKAANLAADEASAKLALDTAVAAAVADATKDLLTKDDAKLAQDAAVAAVHDLYASRKAVEATVGVVALDSAEAVYRFALDHLKVEHKDTAAAGLPALYEASTKAAPVVALDAAPFDPSILGLSHIRKG